MTVAMQRSGFADLPLHGGHVPPWLAARMESLGRAITESIVHHYGTSAFLSRLSDPFWFQAFGSVMGMDWNSSGITTSVLSALKRGLRGREPELGLYVCGGRGKQSRKTPTELLAVAEKRGLNGTDLVRTSRLTARIDNNAIADGFQIYLHGFVVSASGEWAVVQQGLNEGTGFARRYHWHSAKVATFSAEDRFTTEPHTGIVGANRGEILNLVDRRARPAQDALLAVVRQEPAETLRSVEKIMMQRLMLPRHHDVRVENVDLKRLGAVLAVSYDRQLRDFASLLLTENLGPRTLQTLALVAEVVHGAPARFTDPARFSFALGGKDGHPFPVPLKTYDESLGVLRRALGSAKLGHTDKLEGIRRLDQLTRRVEQKLSPQADFEQVVKHERAISASLGGRTVQDDRKQGGGRQQGQQLGLFS